MVATGALGVALALGQPAVAQDASGTFSLPEPTPAPSPVPQGPVDIRDGVVIGPRTIPAEQPPATQAPAATPSPSPTAPAVRAQNESTSANEAEPVATERTQPPAQPSDRVRQGEVGTSLPTASTQLREPRLNGEAAHADTGGPSPDFSAPSPEGASIGAGEDRTADPSAPVVSSPNVIDAVVVAPGSGGLHLWPWIAALLALIGGIAWWVWKRRGERNLETGIAGPTLAAGVRKAIPGSIAAVQLKQKDARAQSEEEFPPPLKGQAVSANLGGPHDGSSPAPNFAIRLDVVSAARSLMAFTLEYRLTIANRSDHALRDLSISAQLACARSGGISVPDGADKPLQLIERIGPHQSRSIVGEVRLPLASVSPLVQRGRPLFIPLVLAEVQVAGFPAKTHSFVIGTPSAASMTRLHPIPLDTPPGGIPGLKAQEVKETPQPQTA